MINKDFQPLPYPQTPETARAYFERYGINRSEWARYFGIDQQAISDHLRGRLKGTWGKLHKVAVLLGLKSNPEHSKAAA